MSRALIANIIVLAFTALGSNGLLVGDNVTTTAVTAPPATTASPATTVPVTTSAEKFGVDNGRGVGIGILTLSAIVIAFALLSILNVLIFGLKNKH